MRTQLLSTHQIEGIRFVACLREDLFVAASGSTLLWFRISNSKVEEFRRWSHGGRAFSLNSLHEPSQAAFQLEHGPDCYSLRLLDQHGFKGQTVPLPFCWMSQVTADSSGMLLAAHGVPINLPGYIVPNKSCVFDMASGAMRWLPGPAAAIEGDQLYFVRDQVLYKKRLVSASGFIQIPNSSELGEAEMVAPNIPSNIHKLVPDGDLVRVVAEDGLYEVRPSGIAALHSWEPPTRAVVCGDICFRADMGSTLHAHEPGNPEPTCFRTSTTTELWGFDALETNEGAREGLLMMVSLKGVLDRFSWRI
jgi:hypothetical protein